MMHGCGELGPIVAHLVEMKLLIICMALGMSGICQAGVPKLLTERAFTSASLAEAANHFITIGEQATFKELKAFIVEDSTQTNYRFSRGYNVDERIGWMFRILYEPKDGIPMLVPKTGTFIPGNIVQLRAPSFGTLDLPENSMPAEKWPLYPLALSGSTFIVLKERYNSKGVPETISHYMEYCQGNGVFRKTPVAIPTRQQALKDAEQLRQSTSWKAIRWVDNGGIGFPMGEQWMWGFIQKQARAIPEETLISKHPNATVPQLSVR
jgi:hypothetical protein